MIGFIFGTVCLITLIALITRHRYGWHGAYAMHRSYGARFGHHHHHPRGHWYGPGSRRAVLYGVLERLDTTPGQDRVITAAIESSAAHLREVREPLRELRSDLGRAMQRDDFDRSEIEALLTRAEGRLRDLRGTWIESLAAIHGALEPEQRKRLAKLIDEGSFGPFLHH